MRAQFNWLRRSAEKRGIAFELTFEEFRQWATDNKYLEKVGVRRMHCDRERAQEGYKIGNMRLLHYRKNCSKGAWSERKKLMNAA